MTFSQYYVDSGKRSQLESTEERKRLNDPHVVATWRRWGPYLSERQWGTVRERQREMDPWEDFTHDHARSRAYRWGEDGLAGISDIQQLLCFSVALWNGRDAILKERLFGLTNPEGNHGEDVKEYYYYLDNTPTHSYMKFLYKYPYQYPYAQLVHHGHAKGQGLEEELLDTGALENGYFDVVVEYAKADPEDILAKITVHNRGRQEQELYVLPTLLFRNTWAPAPQPPELTLSVSSALGNACIESSPVKVRDPITGDDRMLLEARHLYCEGCKGGDVLFTNNETNQVRLYAKTKDEFFAPQNGQNTARYVKDGINDHVLTQGDSNSVAPEQRGTKAAASYRLTIAPDRPQTIRLRFSKQARGGSDPFADFDEIFSKRVQEADEFYGAICPYQDEDLRRVQRQAFAGMLWSKQLYHLIPHRWLAEKKVQDPKLLQWQHMYAKDVLSMPDKWEYPWFASWDLAFHTTTLAIVDPEFAKHQLELLVMEWFQHPNGQLPAYEYDFSNINPPVHAWAALRVYQTEREIYGKTDRRFLDRVFNKLHLNFTWWAAKVDQQGNSVFEGGFLGLDNIRIIDKDPEGNPIEQADGSAWMAMYCLNMLRMAVELAETSDRSKNAGEEPDYDDKYADLARKYLQHFVIICAAMNRVASDGLWDEERGFFMDCANRFGRIPLFSIVGLVPLFAIERIRQRVSQTNPESFYGLYGVLRWLVRNQSDLVQGNELINLEQLLTQVQKREVPEWLEGTIAVVTRDKLELILKRMLDPAEFSSPHGIRGLSKRHLTEPLRWGNESVGYEPAESTRQVMGGNSNWCGPVWMPINYLLVESLRKFHRAMKDLEVDYRPRYDERWNVLPDEQQSLSLDAVADDLSRRLIGIFLRGKDGRRPVFGNIEAFQTDEHFKDHLLFYEYFHGGDQNDQFAGTGLGASHQTGWTGLVANLIQELGVREQARKLNLAEDDS